MNCNNPRYWFPAKRYGLGWGPPLARQGWIFLISWMLILPLGIRFLTPGNKTMRWGLLLERRPGWAAME
jgi:hypothetical protein